MRSICWMGICSSVFWEGLRGAGAFLRMLSRESLLFALNSGCRNSHAFGPYIEVAPSSLFCRTLWKSYLFNCRTKLAKLLCLKCLGRIDFVNFSFSSTTKLSPSSPHRTTDEYEGSSSILYNFRTKSLELLAELAPMPWLSMAVWFDGIEAESMIIWMAKEDAMSPLSRPDWG